MAKLESLESQVTQAVKRLTELLDTYHALATIRDSTRKATHTHVVADVLAASLARHDIRKASARADTLLRNYPEAEGFFEDE